MNCLAIYTMPSSGCLVKGNTWPSRTVDFGAGYTGDLTTAEITFQIKNGNSIFIDRTVGSGITVNSSTQFDIDTFSPSVTENYPCGTFHGGVTIVEADGETISYFAVKLIITDNVTE